MLIRTSNNTQNQREEQYQKVNDIVPVFADIIPENKHTINI